MNEITLMVVVLIIAIIFGLFIMRSNLKMPIRHIPSSFGQSMTIGDREVQEDNLGKLTAKEGTLLVLADGMGKKYGGKIASRIAVETFIDLFKEYKAFEKPQYYFRKAFNAANRIILNKLDGRGSSSVAAAIIINDTLYYALVGNIKIAVFRNGDLVPVSEGHTIDILAKQKYQKGLITKEYALKLLEHHRLYNFVGQDGFHEIEFFSQPLPLRKGDIIALMSDGVYDTLSWREIESELSVRSDAQAKALKIIERVNLSKKPNKDNASIILYRI